MNAKQEMIEHIGNRDVKYIHIRMGGEYDEDAKVIKGRLAEVFPLLDFEYDNGYGGQELFGNIWYTDGTWMNQWWITDCDEDFCPAVYDYAGTMTMFFADGTADTHVYFWYPHELYRPVTASEAEAHLAARYTGTRLAVTECE